MNRCNIICFAALGLLAAVPLCATAQVASTTTNIVTNAAGTQSVAIRTFPPKVLRGKLLITAPPEVQLDGKADRLSPGARIRGTNNMLAMSSVLVGQTLVVNYLREPNGMVHDVWVLTEAEAKILPVATP
jgi:hypothetical protein